MCDLKEFQLNVYKIVSFVVVPIKLNNDKNECN